LHLHLFEPKMHNSVKFRNALKLCTLGHVVGNLSPWAGACLASHSHTTDALDIRFFSEEFVPIFPIDPNLLSGTCTKLAIKGLQK